MSKKKMCEHWIPGKGQPEVCPIIKGKGMDKGDFVCAGYYKCSKGCEIVPKKPKMVKSKANVYFVNGHQWQLGVDEHLLRCGEQDVPCTILIDEKYLRRKP